ncbi:hypothetical protein GCM10023339_46340 [Alloalcanivorax gelatiniphagus]
MLDGQKVHAQVAVATLSLALELSGPQFCVVVDTHRSASEADGRVQVICRIYVYLMSVNSRSAGNPIDRIWLARLA